MATVYPHTYRLIWHQIARKDSIIPAENLSIYFKRACDAWVTYAKMHQEDGVLLKRVIAVLSNDAIDFKTILFEYVEKNLMAEEVLDIIEKHITTHDVLKAYQLRFENLLSHFIKRKLFLQNGITRGECQLHLACRYKMPLIVKKLLASNVQVNFKNGEEQAALHLALEQGQKGIAKLLIAAQADCNSRDSKGNTPLHVAVAARLSKAVHLMLSNKADPHCRNHLGLRALDVALSINSLESVFILINHGSPLYAYEPSQDDFARINERFEGYSLSVTCQELFKYIRKNDVNLVKQCLISMSQTPANKLLNVLWIGLMYCIKSKKTVLAQLLRETLAGVDRTSKHKPLNYFLLHLAKGRHDSDELRKVLAVFLDELNIENYVEVLRLASENGNYVVLKMVLGALKLGEKGKLLRFSVPKSIPCALLLIEHGIEVSVDSLPMAPVIRMLYQKKRNVPVHYQGLLLPKFFLNPNGFDQLNHYLDDHVEGSPLLQHACRWMPANFGPTQSADQYLAYKIVKKSHNNHLLKDQYGRLPIHWALLNNQVVLSKALLDHLLDPNVADNEGETPLHLACRYSTFENVQEIIKKSPDINALNGLGNTPLHEVLDGLSTYPANLRKQEIALSLIQNDAKIDIANIYGITPIILAVENREEEVALAIFAQIKDEQLAHRKSRCGRSLFILACEMELFRLAFLLLPQVNVEQIPHLFLAELHYYASTPAERAILQKLKKKPSEDIRVYLSPLHQALQKGHDKAVQEYISHDQYTSTVDHRGRNALLLACAYADEVTVKKLIAKTNIRTLKQAADKLGKNPLHYVFERRSSFNIACLIELQASLTDTDMYGYTPLQLGVALESITEVSCISNAIQSEPKLIQAQEESLFNSDPERLLSHILQIQWPDPFFQEDMRLFKQACLDWPELVSLMRIIAPQSPLYPSDRFKNLTALYNQISDGHFEITQFLFDIGILNSQQKESSLLMRFWRSPQILNWLEMFKSFGIDLLKTDAQGNTPLHWACQYPHNETVVLELLRRGHNPNSLNQTGESSLSLAIKHRASKSLIDALVINGAV